MKSYTSSNCLSGFMWASVFVSHSVFLKNFRSKSRASQSLRGFREFISGDSDAVIAQMKLLRNLVLVIRIKEKLEKKNRL